MTSSVYNYMNNAKVILPMTAACHDATNLRTLDKSGNGLHFQFGDGSTANTFPAKLTARGYSFDGSNDYLQASANQTNAITQATWSVLTTYNSGNADFYNHTDATQNRCLLAVVGSNCLFYCGDFVQASLLAVSSISVNQANLITARLFTGGIRLLTINGVNGVANSGGTPTPSTTVTSKPRLGLRYDGTRPLNGKIFWFGHWEYALTDIQLRDLEMRLRRQLNDV